MNHSPFEKLIHRAGAETHLSHATRRHMRALLVERVAERPYQNRTSAHLFSILFKNAASLLHRPALATAAIALMLAISSTGVAYAAEGSLPGDALYPMKISVTEPVRALLASTPEEKAAVHRAIAERRIEEAATLANNGALTEKTEQALAANFAAYADAASADEASSDPEEVAVSKTRFASRLAAHEKVLARVDAKRGTASTLALQETIRSRRSTQNPSEGEAVRVTATATLMSVTESVPTAKPSPRRLQSAADEALRSSADLIGANENQLDASSTADAHEVLSKAERYAAEGRRRLAKDDATGASESFEQTLQATAELEVFTRAASRLNVRAFNGEEPRDQHADDKEPQVPESAAPREIDF